MLNNTLMRINWQLKHHILYTPVWMSVVNSKAIDIMTYTNNSRGNSVDYSNQVDNYPSQLNTILNSRIDSWNCHHNSYVMYYTSLLMIMWIYWHWVLHGMLDWMEQSLRPYNVLIRHYYIHSLRLSNHSSNSINSDYHNRILDSD